MSGKHGKKPPNLGNEAVEAEPMSTEAIKAMVCEAFAIHWGSQSQTHPKPKSSRPKNRKVATLDALLPGTSSSLATKSVVKSPPAQRATIVPIPLANSFANLPLPIDEEMLVTPIDEPCASAAKVSPPRQEAQAPKKTPLKRPPPVILHGIPANEINATIQAIQLVATGKVELKCRGQTISVFTESREDWSAAKEVAAKSNREYHTYTPKEDRRQAWVMRGAHRELDPAEIATELREKYQISAEVTVMSRTTRENGITSTVTMPLFQITLDSNVAPERLLQVRTIGYFRVTWERKQGKPQVTQCYNCQRFGHGSSNCGMRNRCIKCNESHNRGECPNSDTSQPAHCVNCGGLHPANFRECPARTRYLAGMPKKAPIAWQPQVVPNPPRPIINPSHIQHGVSYAQAASTTPRKPTSGDYPTSAQSPLEQVSGESTRLFGLNLFELIQKCGSFMANYRHVKDDPTRAEMLISFATSLSHP